MSSENITLKVQMQCSQEVLLKIFIEKIVVARLWRVKPWIDFESSNSTIGKSCNEKFRSRSYDSPGKSETRSKVFSCIGA